MSHQWTFVNDTSNVGRLAFNGGFRFDTFLPYYNEQGKAGEGPFNLNNSSAVLSVKTQTGASFGSVLTTVNPRIARLGIRWTF